MTRSAGRRSPEERVAEGNQLAAQQRHAEAAQIFRSLLREFPGIAELHFNFANSLKGMGDLTGAVRAYRQAIGLKAGLVDAHFNLANAQRDLGQSDEAADGFARVLGLAPLHLPALLGLAELAERRGNPGAAADYCDRALRIDPELAAACDRLARCRQALGDRTGALTWSRRAAGLEPANEAFLALFGDELRAEGAFAQAARIYEVALTLRPDSSALLTNLGILLSDLQRPADALRLHQRALAIDPGLAPATYNRALAHLALGALEPGWRDYEARFAAGATPGRSFSVPAWRGEDLSGRHLFVWREQGIGDELLWSSCLPDLVARARCTIECDPRLVGLYSRAFPTARVQATGRATPPDVDCQTPVGSLPLYLRPALHSFPRRPVLAAEAERVAVWRERLAALGPGLKIGLAWRSLMTRQQGQAARSYTSLADWRPLFALPGVQVISLQYEDDAEERAGWPLVRWPELDLRNDLEGVAALMEALDGVVSVANSVAVLAGCLGRPTLELALQGDWIRFGCSESAWFSRSATFYRDAESTWEEPISCAVAAAATWRDRQKP